MQLPIHPARAIGHHIVEADQGVTLDDGLGRWRRRAEEGKAKAEAKAAKGEAKAAKASSKAAKAADAGADPKGQA